MKPQRGDRGAMGANAETRIYTNRRKPMAGDAKGRLDSTGREEETLQTQTIRANAISRPACSYRVKVVPRRCIADLQLKLYQYTAIDEYSRYCVLSDTCSLTWSEIDWDRKARVIRRMVQREARAGCLENGGSKQGSSYKKLQKSPGSASC